MRLWFRRRPRSIAASGICTGDLLTDNFFWLQQLQPAYQAWHQATGGSAIETHIYGPSEVLAQPDAALLTQILHDTYRAFPELRGSLLHSVVLRNDATHTLFTPADPAPLAGRAGRQGRAWWPAATGSPTPTRPCTSSARRPPAWSRHNRLLGELGLEPWPILDHPLRVARRQARRRPHPLPPRDDRAPPRQAGYA